MGHQMMLIIYVKLCVKSNCTLGEDLADLLLFASQDDFKKRIFSVKSYMLKFCKVTNI